MSGMVRPSGTYETLDEQRERLSPAEERFERARPTIELFLGPVVFLGLYLLPPAATTGTAGFGGDLRLRVRLLAADLHAPNASIYGSGMIPITEMVWPGIAFDILGAVLTVTGVAVMSQLLGLV
ncbi:MAG: hypothetical protein M3272_03350 [Actinomycetota bacterium]|nr:hypothetical protein [Actinomycetota bacterium]